MKSLIYSILFSIVFFSCSELVSPGNKADVSSVTDSTLLATLPDSAVVASRMYFFSSSDTILLTIPSLKYVSDTIPVSTIRIARCPFRFSNDTLIISGNDIAGPYFSETYSVDMYYRRIAGESGLTGLWGLERTELEFKDSASSIDSINGLKIKAQIDTLKLMHLLLNGSNATFYTKMQPYSEPIKPTELWWVNYISVNNLRISPFVFNDTVLFLLGNVTKDTVFISIDSLGNKKYNYRDYGEVGFGRQPKYPDWLYTFVIRNTKYLLSFKSAYSDTLSKSNISVELLNDTCLMMTKKIIVDPDTQTVNVFLTERTDSLQYVYFTSSDTLNHTPQPHVFNILIAESNVNKRFPDWFINKFVNN